MKTGNLRSLFFEQLTITLIGLPLLFMFIYGFGGSVYHARQIHHHNAHYLALNRQTMWAEVAGDKPFTPDGIGQFAKDVQPEFKSFSNGTLTVSNTYDPTKYGDLYDATGMNVWANVNSNASYLAPVVREVFVTLQIPKDRDQYENQVSHFPLPKHLHMPFPVYLWLGIYLFFLSVVASAISLITQDARIGSYRFGTSDDRRWQIALLLLAPVFYGSLIFGTFAARQLKDKHDRKVIEKSDANNPLSMELTQARKILEKATADKNKFPGVREVEMAYDAAKKAVRSLAEFPDERKADEARIRAAQHLEDLTAIRDSLVLNRNSHKELMAEYHESKIKEAVDGLYAQQRRELKTGDTEGKY